LPTKTSFTANANQSDESVIIARVADTEVARVTGEKIKKIFNTVEIDFYHHGKLIFTAVEIEFYHRGKLIFTTSGKLIITTVEN